MIRFILLPFLLLTMVNPARVSAQDAQHGRSMMLTHDTDYLYLDGDGAGGFFKNSRYIRAE